MQTTSEPAAARTEDHAIQFNFSKSKVLTLLSGGAPLLLVGGKIFQTPAEKMNSLFPGAAYVLPAFGAIMVLLYAFIILFVLLRLRSNKPALIVSDDGITDHSSGVSVGFIPWEDVLEINAKNILASHYIRIKVKDPEKYIQRESNFLKRWLIRSNHRTFKAAISISAGTIRCSFEELKDLLDRRFKAYQESKGAAA